MAILRGQMKKSLLDSVPDSLGLKAADPDCVRLVAEWQLDFEFVYPGRSPVWLTSYYITVACSDHCC